MMKRRVVMGLSYAAAALAATEKKYLETQPSNQSKEISPHKKNDIHLVEQDTEKKFPKPLQFNSHIDQPGTSKTTTSADAPLKNNHSKSYALSRFHDHKKNSRPLGGKSAFFPTEKEEGLIQRDVKLAQAEELISQVLHEDLKRHMPAFIK